MQVNIQGALDEQKANFDHFNELKIFEHHFKYLLGQKQGVRQFKRVP